MMWRYTLKYISGGSKKYGNCEICNEPTDQMYSMNKEKEYKKDHWTIKGTAFGHAGCLLKNMNKPYKLFMDSQSMKNLKPMFNAKILTDTKSEKSK